MSNLDNILAKSINYGGTTLLDHTIHVAKAIECIANGFYSDFDIEMAKKGALLHDLGKAHPNFQNRIKNINAKTIQEEAGQNIIHRHELSSLAFLPAFPQEEWDILIDMVVGHHKSIENDSKERGILDLDNKYRNWKRNHLKDWDTWSSYCIGILNEFGYQTSSIDKVDAEKALDYTVEYCESKGYNWSKWKGLLMSADHFASAFGNSTELQLNKLFEIPNLEYYNNPNRQNALFPLSTIPVEDSRKHTIVVAPTGAGKTDFLLKRCKGRVFYTLPFQASINAMWERFRETIPNRDVRLLHATSKIVVGREIEEKIIQPMVGSCIKVLTPHQIASIVFGIAGFESMMLDLQGCDIVLDEIHTYSDYSKAMVLEIVKTLLRLDCRIHIGTATMPTILYSELLEILGGKDNTYEVSLPDLVLKEFNRHKIYKEKDDDSIMPIITSAIKNKEKVLVIYNTVKTAQEGFKLIKKLCPEVPMMLIHSRFRRADRVELESKLKLEFNGSDVNSGTSPCVVVSTQVVEVSLDISFDRMITQCAPLDSLIQRFGRVNRRRTTQTIGKYKPIHVIAPKDKTLPYDKGIVEASYNQLPNKGDILDERELQSKIDIVYNSIETKKIDMHLIYKDNGYVLKELTHCRKAVLIEALEIEGASCILEEDRERYLESTWEERINLEIPISWKVIAPYHKKYEQLDVGSNPFVIPQDFKDYNVYGLQLVEPNNFL